jgi:DNA polymerase-3 subunit gamma/tau
MGICELRQARKGAAVAGEHVPRCSWRDCLHLKRVILAMSYRVLALKWRPRDLAAVVGQQATILALQHALDNNQIHHAYLFTGTRGVGKTTIARILAKCLNCEKGVSSQPCAVCGMCTSIDSGDCVDVIEVDAASRTKVEDTRDLLDNMPYAPVQGRFKVYIIDEVHMLSNHSFNALLKTLEEPPAHVKFILATTDPQKLPVTVLSRCLQFHLRHFTIEQISQQLANILGQEAISFETPALVTIAQCANGSMRDALSLLEQVIAFSERNITLDAAQKILGTSVRASAIQILEQVILANATKALTIVRELAANNADFNQVLKTLQTLIHQVSLVQVVPEGLEASTADVAILKQLAQQVTPLDLQLFYQATLLGVRDLPYAPDLMTGFEMIVLRMLAFQPALVNTQVTVTKTETKIIEKVAAAPVALPPKVIEQPIVKPIAIEQAVSLQSDNPSWAEIILQLNLPGLTKVIAENCSINKWQADAVELTLQETQKPLLNAKHIERIQEALEKRFARKINLKINIGAVSSETPAAQGQRMAQANQSAAEAAIRADKHIQQLEQAFAATIEEINVRGD